MHKIYDFIGLLLLALMLTFVAWVLYKAICTPGSHKIDRLGENNKIGRKTFKILLAIFLIVVVVLYVLINKCT